jgi:hypothetical protein
MPASAIATVWRRLNFASSPVRGAGMLHTRSQLPSSRSVTRAIRPGVSPCASRSVFAASMPACVK